MSLSPVRSKRTATGAGMLVLLVGFIFAPLASVSAVPAPQDDDAASPLAKSGLVKVGNLYLVPEEVELRAHLADLKKQEKEFADAQKKMKEALASNAAMMAQIDKAKKEIEQIDKARTTANAAQANMLIQARNQRVEFLNNMQGRVYDVQTRSESPILRTTITDFATAQANLGATLEAILAARTPLATAYDKFKEDEAITAALAETKSKLGPAKPYESEFKRAEKLHGQVYTNDVPVYMTNLQHRLIGIVGGKTPVSFTYAVQNEFNTIAGSALEAAGVKIPADAPQGALMAGERKIGFKQIKLSTLRLGKHVFHDVPVLALAPEGEDFGSTLGSKLFDECQVNFLQQELKFELQPKQPEEPPESK